MNRSMPARVLLPLLAILPVPAACGGGGGGGGDDFTGPVAAIGYPSSGTRTDAGSITVSGESVPGATPIAALRVNGMPVSVVATFDRWEISVPLGLGANDIEVEIEDESGETFPLSAVAEVERVGAVPLRPVRIDYDTTRDVALFTDRGTMSLHALDPDTGAVATVSGDDRGSGPFFEEPLDVVHDPVNDRIFVLDTGLGDVVEVDPLTGDRSLLATTGFDAGSATALAFHLGSADLYATTQEGVFVVDADSGVAAPISLSSIASQGVPFDFPLDLCVDADAGLIHVLDQERVLGVDPLLGTRTSISDATTGGGVPLPSGISTTHDPSTGEVFVQADDGSVLGVDPATGDRRLVASAEETGLEGPFGLALEPDGARLLAVDEVQASVVAVDVAGGTAERVLSNERGQGPRLVRVNALAGFGGEILGVGIVRRDGDLVAGMMAIDPATGDRRLVSESDFGSEEPGFGTPTHLTVDASGRRAYYSDIAARRVVRVDLDTGARSVLVEGGRPDQPGLARPYALAHLPADPEAGQATDRIALFGRIRAAIFMVDPSNGDATLFSSDAQAGPSLVLAEDLVHDAENGRLLASIPDSGGGRIVAIDLETGERSLLTDAGAAFPGGGAALEGAADTTIGPFGRLALVRDRDRDRVVAVDLQTGFRTIVAAADAGAGLSTRDLDGLAVLRGAGQVFAFSSDYRALLGVGTAGGDRVIVSK